MLVRKQSCSRKSIKLIAATIFIVSILCLLITVFAQEQEDTQVQAQDEEQTGISPDMDSDSQINNEESDDLSDEESDEAADNEPEQAIEQDTDTDETNEEQIEEPVETTPEPALPVIEEETASAPNLPQNMLLKYFKQGGNFMWPLVICSIIALGIMIERFIRLLLVKLDPSKFYEKLYEIFDKKGRDAALSYCEENSKKMHVARIMKDGLDALPKGISKMEKSIESSAFVEINLLERGLTALSALANIAPLLGFLGTVVGMIISFEDISTANNMGADVVSRGIYQALITTAAGLMIAIPIFGAHHYFSSRVEKFTLLVEKVGTRLVELAQQKDFKD